MRAMASVEPPAANGATMVMGRVGHDCAPTEAVAPTSAAQTAIILLICMIPRSNASASEFFEQYALEHPLGCRSAENIEKFSASCPFTGSEDRIVTAHTIALIEAGRAILLRCGLLRKSAH